MQCYRPILGYRSSERTQNGKRRIVFNARDAHTDQPVQIPCGQCIGCRLERSRQWAIRCVHEAQMHEENCFLTLTYAGENKYTLVLKDFQDFMKRLRKKYGIGIRFFHCGEYGEKNQRPHYHAIIFGFDFPDKYKWRKTETGEQTWRSESLEELWPHGISEIGTVTFESAAYVARYVTKKITGEKAEDHYAGRSPEYATMSRRPGIGKEWYEKYKNDVINYDEVVLRGVIMKPPKYYDRLLEVDDWELLWQNKIKRKALGKIRQNEPLARIAVRETVHELNAQLLKRKYENGS